MATTKKNGAVQRDASNIGLFANGSCGPWEFAIDEATSGPDRWFAQIDGPSVTFSFEISGPNIVQKLIKFLESSAGRTPELQISKDKKTPVVLLRDDEYADRFFLLVGQTSNPIVRFAIAGADVAKLVTALRHAEEDLGE